MTSTFDLDDVRRRLASAPEGRRLSPIGLRAVEIGDGALAMLPGLVASLTRDAGSRGKINGPVAVLTDRVPKKYRSNDLLDQITAALSSDVGQRGIRTVLAGRETETRVHADQSTVDSAAERCAGAAALVAVGSGTIADIGKVVAARHELPYVVVQTANSVNGFADDRSVLLIDGVKRTVPSRWPDALVVDLDLVSGAPPAMNLAGLGDLMAMFTAPADWYLANILGMDDLYAPTVVSLSRYGASPSVSIAPLLPGGDRGALAEMAAALTMSGISMGVASTTAPCSGMEHVVSHMLEMAASSRGEEAALHGAQVGAASVIAAILWERVLGQLAQGGWARARVPGAPEAEAAVRQAFLRFDPSGQMAAECWRGYEEKLARWARAGDRLAQVSAQWRRHEPALRELLLPPSDLVGTLRAAGAPARIEDLVPRPTDDDVWWAVAHCNLMRDRFSVADLAFFLGLWGAPDIGSVLADAARLPRAP